jgi:hypothetical protein
MVPDFFRDKKQANDDGQCVPESRSRISFELEGQERQRAESAVRLAGRLGHGTGNGFESDAVGNEASAHNPGGDAQVGYARIFVSR